MEGCHGINPGFSNIVRRTDQNFDDKRKDMNYKLKRCCSSKAFLFINNHNISDKYLNRSLLHLNRTGNKLFSNNVIEALRFVEKVRDTSVITNHFPCEDSSTSQSLKCLG